MTKQTTIVVIDSLRENEKNTVAYLAPRQT